MSSPAERYAAAKARGRRQGTPLGDFIAARDFPLDDFQLQACEALQDGHSVLVAAPTGAGKTVVGEFAVDLALAAGTKVFYTAPIKALSNQKYRDLVAAHSLDTVGLLTGDQSINPDAPVVVMTTEVLRNMLYAGSTSLSGLSHVVMDEVHYLADRFRGAVWEEVIIHLPASVTLVSLSATVSNVEEFGAWLEQVRGNHRVVVSEVRPVPLYQHMLVGDELYDLLRGSRVSPELVSAIRARTVARAESRSSRRGMGRRGQHVDSAPKAVVSRVPSRPEVIANLDDADLLPSITFIFSRAGCAAAVDQLLRSGLRLVSPQEGEANRRYVEERMGGIGAGDLTVLGYDAYAEGISRGFAAHHAGMLPIFREIVEELFVESRVRAVFATETLALGINMPARAVVLEKLVKFNGDSHADVTPAEYTQLTGRAGRRGIDAEGHAIVVWSPGMDPGAVGGLASNRTYPLRSSFRPTYNMAVNLVAQVGRSIARDTLETSFAQFQADASVVGYAAQLKAHQEAMDRYAQGMECSRGDFRAYGELRERLTEAEKVGKRNRVSARRAAAAVSLDELKTGDVVHVAARRGLGWAVVVAPARSGRGYNLGPGVVTQDAAFRRLTVEDAAGPLNPVATMRVPRQSNPKSPSARRTVAAELRRVTSGLGKPARADKNVEAANEAEIRELRSALAAHPSHVCPDREEHAGWAQRWWKLKRESVALEAKIAGRTNTIAATFDRICDALTELEYLDGRGETVTEAGQRLRRIYTEHDLLTAECLRRGVWDSLKPAEFAAAVALLIHEPRSDDVAPAPRMPTAGVARAVEETLEVWESLDSLAQRHALERTNRPDPALVGVVHDWARGGTLTRVLAESDLSPGDFVRRAKHLVDVLGQVAAATDDPSIRSVARGAMDLVRRDVVATDRIE